MIAVPAPSGSGVPPKWAKIPVMSSSLTRTEASRSAPRRYAPERSRAVRVPWYSAVLSSTVATVSVPVPSVPTVTCRRPLWPLAAKRPLSATSTVTESGAAGAGVAVSANRATSPSSTRAAPARASVTVVAASSSSMVTVVVGWAPVACRSGNDPMPMVKVSSGSNHMLSAHPCALASGGSSTVRTVKVCEVASAGMVMRSGDAS